VTASWNIQFDLPLTSSCAGLLAQISFPHLLEVKPCPSVDTLSKGGPHFAWLLTSEALPADAISPQPDRSLICLEKSSLVCRLLLLKAYEPWKRVQEDPVVKQMFDSWGMQYAVIAGLRTETGPEHLVIAYPNEKSLRDLIAAASIIAVGFSSREEAAAGGRASVPTAIYRQQMPEGIAGRGSERYRRRLGRFLVTSYSHVATAAIAIFTSRNAVSAVIRMALGSSV
jgi:hypothetical protein